MRGFIDGEYQDGELRGLTFVAGKRGMGKTTEMARLLGQSLGGVLFFDSLSKHTDVLRGYQVVSQPGELKDYLRVNVGRRFRVLYQPHEGELHAHFEAVSVIVRCFGWMVYGIDELDMLCGPRYGDSRMAPGLYHLVNYGRHHRVAMIATARAPMQVPRGFTSNCLEMRLFRITEDDHLKYFQNYIGAANVERLRTLDKYKFLRWRDGEDEAQVCGGLRSNAHGRL